MVGRAHGAPGDIVTAAGGNGEGLAVGQRPSAVAFAGPLLCIADGEHSVVRALDTMTGVERVVAGNVYAPGAGLTPLSPNGDGGPAVYAQFGTILELATGPRGSLYIVDMWSSTVRRWDPAGTITTVRMHRVDRSASWSRRTRRAVATSVGRDRRGRCMPRTLADQTPAVMLPPGTGTSSSAVPGSCRPAVAERRRRTER